MNRTFHCVAAAAVAALLSSVGAVRATPSDAADLSLEDLLKTEVVTVSRKSQSLQSTAAAAFVITREDIERSGATSLPEALRMAPGVEVARMANNHWAVTVRGFNGRFANKLLVLMDGRSIYSPLFSGVMWEFEDTLLEDVERIEVIRGPGSALWGANAVNGVINIITRKARDTQGDLLVGSVGSSSDRVLGAYRHGGETADGHYRVWGKAFDRGPSETPSGAAGNDTWRAARIGFRRDGLLAAGPRYSVSGDAYGGPTADRWNEADVASPVGYTTRDKTLAGQGAHVLGRVEWRHESGAESAFQSYFDYSDLDVHNTLRQRRTTLDLDYQLRTVLNDRNELIWGLGYRLSHDAIDTSSVLKVSEREGNFTLFNAFVQDEFVMLPDTLRVIAGARLEHNSMTGFEPQPNLRMIWTPTPSQSFWGAASHAVRTPSRAESNAQIDLSVMPAQPPFLPLPVLTRAVVSGDHLESEKVNTFELGYRQQFGASLSFDIAAFYSRYRELRTAELGAQSVVIGPTPYVLQEITTVNGLSATTHGIELSIDWHPTSWWRLQPTYSTLKVSGTADSADPVMSQDAATLGDASPRRRWSLRSSVTVGARQQWDVWLRQVGALRTVDAQGNTVPSYTTIDLRYAWRPTPALELSIVGQNLLQRRHAEFTPELLPSQTLVVQRSAYVKARYTF